MPSTHTPRRAQHVYGQSMGGRDALNGTTAAGHSSVKHVSRQDRRRVRSKQAARFVVAAVVFAVLASAGVWLFSRYGEVELAVGESGSIVSTTTVEGSGRIADVSDNPAEEFNYKADNGRFGVGFSDKPQNDASVQLSTSQGTSLSFGLASTDGVPRTVDENTIQFVPDPDIEVKYTVLDDRIKEDIILKAPPETNTFTFDFDVTGLAMVRSPDGYHFFDAAGDEIFWLQEPTVKSLNSVAGTATLTISDSKMHLTVDQDFLDKAFYPVTIDPTIVGTSSSSAATAYTNSRRLVETSDANLALFYQVGTDIVYRVSQNYGDTWGAPVIASASNSVQFDLVSDSANNIYLAYLDDSAASIIRFRKLTYAGSGSWTAGSQWAVESGGTGRGFPAIFRSASGRLWVAYRYFDGTNYTLRVRYSDSSLPGWTQEGSTWSAPTEIAAPSTASRMYPTFVEYKGQPSVVFLYPSGAADGVFVWRYWTGTAWSAEETVPGVTALATTYPLFTAVSTYDNSIHILYSTTGIRHVRRDDGGGWQAPVVVSATSGDLYPSVTTNGGGLRVFWNSYIGSSQRRLSYKSYNGVSWENTPTVLTPTQERTFDRVWTFLAVTPWNDTLTDRDALFRFTEGATYYGNRIGEASSLGYALNTTTRRASVKFVADATATVTALRLFMNRTGTAPTYRVGLQTDAAGYPSGSWLGGNAYVDAANPGGGWMTFDIPDVGVSGGTTYHIVVQYVAGVVDASNYARFSYITPGLIPGEAVTTYSGATWATLAATPAYVLDRSDSVLEGQSIRAGTTYSVNLPGLRAGERFTPETTVTPSAIDMRITRVGVPTDNLRVKVVQGTDTELFSSDIATPLSPTTATWLSAPISSLTMSPGQTYRVFATSDGVDPSNYYSITLGLSNTGSPYPELTWGGTTNTATNALAGSGWTDKTFAAGGTTGSDVPLFGSNGDMLYLGMMETFDYAYFVLGVAASASVNPAWEYWDGTGWSPLTITENPGYGFTGSGRVGFTSPGNWAPVALNGEATAKYYVRVRRTAATLATAPVASQMSAVRGNSYPTTPVKYSTVLPFAWTEGVASPYRIKFDKLTATAPEISSIEARHIDRDSHETTVTWLTHVPATSQIVYDTTSHATGTYNDYPYKTTLDPTLVQSHVVRVSSLASDTVYYYRILTMNADGDLTVSDEHLIPPGDLTVHTDKCASCHRSHTAWLPDTWTDRQGDPHSGLLIRQP